MTETTSRAGKPPVNWPATLVLGLTPIAALVLVPWYGIVHGYSGWAWAWFAIFTLLTGIGIGSGYHRLWSHRAYKASPWLQAFLAFWGGIALQNSVIWWSARHRVHHRDVDDNDKDPYSIGRGFWFAHMGWMLREYPSGEVDLDLVPDLQKNPIVAWQHRWYYPMAIFGNVVLPLFLGWLAGDIIGVFLLAGLLRLVVNHHLTWFINSLAHMWGSQPYTDENTARDNWVLGLLTYGEGYHNYHHLFQNDYRNGVRWYQFDINKWFIGLCSALGLAWDLQRAPQFKIQRARLAMEFKHARERAEQQPMPERWREALEREYAEFMQTVKRWQQLQLERVELGKQQLAERWERTTLQQRYRELENALRIQRRRVAALSAAIKF